MTVARPSVPGLRLLPARVLLLALAGALAGATAVILATRGRHEAAIATPTHEAASRTAPPTDLQHTGLYADWPDKIVADDVIAFSPQYPLWSDGARKSRWIRLPKGAAIDVTDPDAWTFPIGTQLWKEFSFADRRIETRYMELGTDGRWMFASYVWSADESNAALSSATGGSAQALAVELGDRRQHQIPTLADCRACHDAQVSPVLGFSALQLSSDRDPHAPHAEALPPNAIDLRMLVSSGLAQGWPEEADLAPRIDASTATERAARGYLHGNCGGCHQDRGSLATLDMDLAYELGDPQGDRTPLVVTTLGRRSRAALPGSPGVVASRVEPGNAARSVLVGRMSSRAPAHQMPPLGTHLVDDVATTLVSRWIDELDSFGTTPTAKEKP